MTGNRRTGCPGSVCDGFGVWLSAQGYAVNVEKHSG